MCDPFHVGLEPQPMHQGSICCAPANQDFSRLPKSEPTSVVETAWWWIHMPIHCIWRLSITLYMYGWDVWTNPCGFGASTNAYGLHLVPSSDARFQPTCQIVANKCDGNGMMMDPYAHPQHMKVVNHLLYVWSGCDNYTMCLWNLNHCRNTEIQHQAVTGDFSRLPKLGLTCVVETAWW